MHVKRLNQQAEVYSRHAELCKVLSHPLRLQVLHTLRDREMSVSELANRLKASIGNLSQHLNMMRRRRVLDARKEGNSVCYRLANPKMLEAFDLIRKILFEQMRREGVLVRQVERARPPVVTRTRRAGGDAHGRADRGSSRRPVRKREGLQCAPLRQGTVGQ